MKKHPSNIDNSVYDHPKKLNKKEGIITRIERETEHEHAKKILIKAKRLNMPVTYLTKDRNGNYAKHKS